MTESQRRQHAGPAQDWRRLPPVVGAGHVAHPLARHALRVRQGARALLQSLQPTGTLRVHH